jgi:nuclear pore complex protein Nup98-Nup96
MSFGGGFGGFGNTNQQQQQQQQPSTGFGGFGANTNTPSSGTYNLDRDKTVRHSLTAEYAGFGSNTAGGFGATSNTGGGMFGNTSSTPGGFGSTPGKSLSSIKGRVSSGEAYTRRSSFSTTPRFPPILTGL